MHPNSDIAGLFSNLSPNGRQYQEITARRRLEADSTRWALLSEIYRSAPPATQEKPQRK